MNGSNSTARWFVSMFMPKLGLQTCFRQCLGHAVRLHECHHEHCKTHSSTASSHRRPTMIKEVPFQANGLQQKPASQASHTGMISITIAIRQQLPCMLHDPFIHLFNLSRSTKGTSCSSRSSSCHVRGKPWFGARLFGARMDDGRRRGRMTEWCEGQNAIPR